MKIGPVATAVAISAVVLVKRRKLEPTVIVGGLIVAVVLAFYGSGLVKLPDLESLIDDAGDALGKWTYLVVAVAAFVETGAFIGLIAPGETVMVFGGVVAGQGRIDLYTLIGIVWIAAVAGDLTSFYLGRRLGRSFLVQHGPKFQITEDRLTKVEAFFDRHGGKAILVGRFVGLVRAIAPFLAGSSGMRLKRFLPYDVIGAGLWATTFIVVGYIFWNSFARVVDYAEKGAFAFGSLIVVIATIVVVVRWLRQEENRVRARAWIDEQLERPALRPLARALRPVWRLTRRPRRFVIARITPGDLGLEATTLAAIVAVGSFAFIAPILSLRDSAVTPADVKAAEIVADIQADWLISIAKVVSELGSLTVVTALVAVACLYVAYRRHYVEAIVLPIALVVTYAAVHITQGAKDRPHPPGSLVEVSGGSFPCSQAAYAVAWVAVALVVGRLWGPLQTTIVVIAGIVIATAVALSRVYLDANYFSDAAGGAGLAAMAFAFAGMAALVVGYVRHNGAAG